MINMQLKINYSTLVLSIDSDVQVALVDYNPQPGSRDAQKPFKYKVSEVGELKKGDIVTVPTSSDHRCGYTTCKVVKPVEALDPDYEKDVNWIVHKVDTEMHKRILHNENLIIDSVKAARREAQQNAVQQALGLSPETVSRLPLLTAPIVEEEKEEDSEN
jgi:hypothetical protein